jgi:hypothetical protein
LERHLSKTEKGSKAMPALLADDRGGEKRVTVIATSPKENNRSAGDSAVMPRLFVLELNAGSIHSMNTDGSDRKTLVTDCQLPDGIAVDAEAGHIYWTNMGIPNLNDGSVERADLDGNNRRTIVYRSRSISSSTTRKTRFSLRTG